MATQVTKFIAQDGTPFDTEAEADHHDARMALSSKVEEFIILAGLERAAMGYARKLFPQFMLFVNEGVHPPKAEKVEKVETDGTKPKRGRKAKTEAEAPAAEDGQGEESAPL